MLAANLRRHARVRRDPQFLRMPAKLMYPVPVGLQHLRDEKPEFSIAQHRHRAPAGNLHLIQNLARGGKRLGEYGDLGGDRVGNYVQIAFRQRQKFAEAPGWRTMPSTDRSGQWRPSPRLHQEQSPHARLISPTTRLPISSFESASTTSPTNSWPGTPENP